MYGKRLLRLASAMPVLFAAFAFRSSAQSAAPAQQPSASQQRPAAPPSINLVMPTGPGRIIIPSTGMQWKGAHLYGNTSKYAGPGYWEELKPADPAKADKPPVNPVLEFTDKATGAEVSYILFPSPNDSASAPGCRNRDAAAAFPLTAPLAGTIDATAKGNVTTTKGQSLATLSYAFRAAKGAPALGKEVDGFLANVSACAEIRVSKMPFLTGDDAVMNAALESFTFDPNYVPTVQDYYGNGTILFRLKSYVGAGVYYQRALDVLPSAAPPSARRMLTDQLSIAYALSGQFEQSRAANEAAIKIDPDYPTYYYNLARADAERGDAANAKTHLQDAFKRDANLLPGEQLPDPTQDESIQKLRNNADFWSFVQTL